MSDAVDNINRHYQSGFAACLESYAVELKKATLYDILLTRLGQHAVDIIMAGDVDRVVVFKKATISPDCVVTLAIGDDKPQSQKEE